VKSEVTTGVSRPSDIDPYARWLIKHKVRRLVDRHGFRRDDEQDLHQELAMHVVAGMRRHDPARASTRTFADRIITTKIASIIQHATAQKRDRRRVQAIDEVSEPSRPTHQAAVDARLDVIQAVASLPDDLRSVATLLMEHGSEAAVIRAGRMTREMVRGRRRRIAAHLRGRGLA
jgi:hypothetical protein